MNDDVGLNFFVKMFEIYLFLLSLFEEIFREEEEEEEEEDQLHDLH